MSKYLQKWKNDVKNNVLKYKKFSVKIESFSVNIKKFNVKIHI